jgi:hypothetical protein
MTDAIQSAADDRRHKERRKRRLSFVFRERRTGFDRRDIAVAGPLGNLFEHSLMRLRDAPGSLAVLLLIVNFLNLADFALTLNALSLGGYEVNPVMRALFISSPLLAGLVKVALIVVATLLVWFFRKYRRTLIAAVLMVAIFAAVFFYHIYGLTIFI